jgi:dienelactone hydrolase
MIPLARARLPGAISRLMQIPQTCLAACLAGLLSLASAGNSLGADELPALNRFPRMMQEWLVGQVAAVERAGDERRAAVKNAADAEAYVQSVRERIRLCFGPEPERAPLNARVTARIERGTHVIENVVFESRPGFLVTANLYLPASIEGKIPGVIGTCGHSTNGKQAEAYQAFAQGLARKGYACLIFDPPGQGERFQYPTEDGVKSRYGPGVAEHIQSGNQQTLVGEFLGAWFAWDGIRALDYLLSRPEVDPERVGVTGNSGGGTQTTWLCGLDSRWTMAAPACFVTTFRRNAENELPADTEQCPPNALALGLDHSDFLAAMAPNPVIILAKEYDYFDARGAEEAHRRLRALHGALGHPERAALFIGPSYHGYTQENREAMYGFFNQAAGVAADAAEPELLVEKDETLWAVEGGQVHRLPGAKSIFQFTRDKAEDLAKARGGKSGDELKAAVSRVLALPEGVAELAGDAPEYRILRSSGNRGYPAKGACSYAVETEPGVFALVTRLHSEPLMSRPPPGRKRALLYVSHRSADREMRGEEWFKELTAADPEADVYAMDTRGIGDSQPDICGKDQFLRPYGSDYFLSAHSLMLGKPYQGQRVTDVLRVIQWLRAQGHEEIHLAGRGWGALSAGYAALLAEPVRRVTLRNWLESYHAVATTEDYRWPYAALLPNVLAEFDLPEVRAQLAKTKALAESDPWGALDGMSE